MSIRILEGTSYTLSDIVDFVNEKKLMPEFLESLKVKRTPEDATLDMLSAEEAVAASANYFSRDQASRDRIDAAVDHYIKVGKIVEVSGKLTVVS